MTTVPPAWRSALPRLGYPVPPDLTPPGNGADIPAGTAGAVRVNVPLPLIRQSISSSTEYWHIPEPVARAYERYRPTPLWRARGFERVTGARVPIYIKDEGRNVSGSHKLNTAIAQAHYYRQAGVAELVTGTGAGQWGSALAAACAAEGLRCTVFMVGSSLAAKPYRGILMRLLGAEVIASPSTRTDLGSRHHAGGNSLSLAIGEAASYAAADSGRAFVIGSGETYSIVHQSVIGLEAACQLAEEGAAVDSVVGSLGAGSNFGGIALPFFAAAREAGTAVPILLAAESAATPKLTRGVYAYDQTDATGTGPMEAMYTVGSGCPVPQTHAAGLRFHGAAKLLSAMRYRRQIAAAAFAQREALAAGQRFALSEGSLPAPESGHALAAAAALATQGVTDRGVRHVAREGVLVCLSGQGYLDLGAYAQFLDGQLEDESLAGELISAAVAGLQRAGEPTGPIR